LQAVERALLPADGEVAFAVLVAYDAGRERGEVEIVAPVDGQIFDGALVDGGGDGRARRFHDGRFRRHGHVNVRAADRQANVERGLAADRDGDVLQVGRLEALHA
jgi:hypothetical protein